MNKAIEVKGLKKSYGRVEAVKGIDFYAEEGKLFAFLGPNGAGKSTTIDIVCTFLKPDEGEVIVDGLVLGQSDAEIRKRIGAVFQDGLLDKRLTIAENLKARGGFYGLKGKALAQAVETAACRNFSSVRTASFRADNAAAAISPARLSIRRKSFFSTNPPRG